MRSNVLGSGLVAALVLASCTSKGLPEAGLTPDQVPEPPAASETNTSLAINSAVTNADRPGEDVERDASRNPAAVLEFMGLMPGDTLLEIEAGSGYFTEIFSSYVGEGGKVYMQNPAAFDGFLGDSVTERLDGLSNVEYLKSDFDALTLADASVDAVTWFQGPHELWYTPDSGMALVTDPDAAFPEVMRVLKPGGSFTIIDHSAPAGSPATTGGDTHRIDPQIVKDMAMEAGFVFVSESQIFENTQDDLTVSVFDPSVRGTTDQFLLKFEKPE